MKNKNEGNPLKSGGEEKKECFGNEVFSRVVSFREYSHPGYEVYDWNGKQVYPEVAEGAAGGMGNADCPFLVKVSIPDLNIRKGAGTNTAKTGQYTGIGIFTIVEVREGKGSDKGWGRLKSRAGWIALDFCQRV